MESSGSTLLIDQNHSDSLAPSLPEGHYYCMKYILFGVSCVGKTTLGKLIAETLGYEFSDMDERIREIYGRSIDFQNQFPFVYERDKRKAGIMSSLLDSVSDNCILSYMPCWYARPLNGILNRQDTVGIRLVDSPDNIFDRIIYTDDNDQLLPDDGYKEKHESKPYYQGH